MLQVRELRDETGGFYWFIPLEYRLGTTRLVSRPPSADHGLRTIAAARLLLDNLEHVKAYWVMLGEETASVALNFGASDIDGTIVEEKIAHYAPAESPVGQHQARLVCRRPRLLHGATGRPMKPSSCPVERSRYIHAAVRDLARSRELTMDALLQASRCLKTLAHPHRDDLQLLLEGEHTVADLAGACGVPRHVASEHLGVMRERGLLTVECRVRRAYYWVVPGLLDGIMDSIRRHHDEFGEVEARR
jgi:hypothetical protein